MAQQRHNQLHLPSDPQFLLSYMEDLDSDDSDVDFDGYLSDNEENEMEEMNVSDMMDANAEMMEVDGEEQSAVAGGSAVACASAIASCHGATAAPSRTGAARIPSFQENTGVADTSANKPVEFFDQFFTEEVNDSIVEESNRYAVQINEEFLAEHPRARAHYFVKNPFTVSDLYRFLAVIIVMGVVSLPRIGQYWSKRWPFHSVNVSSIMSRDRFQLFLKFLPLVDNDTRVPPGQTGHDKLFKLRPFLNRLVGNFQKAYYPGKEICIDESMIGFKGRLSFLQYMQKKTQNGG